MASPKLDPIHSTDDELMVEIASGRQDAFRILFERYGSQLRSFFLRMFGGAVAQAEDVSQGVWEKVAIHAPEYVPQGRFKSWLFTIARNTAMDALRKESSWMRAEDEGQKTLAVLEAPSSGHNFAEEDLVSKLDLSELKRRIDALPPRQRYVILAWISEDCSQKDLAKELEISVKGVESLLSRARAQLMKAAQEVVGEPDELETATRANRKRNPGSS